MADDLLPREADLDERLRAILEASRALDAALTDSRTKFPADKDEDHGGIS